jgi:hypothetical protein
MKYLKSFQKYNEGILTATTAIGAVIFAIKKISDYIYDWRNNNEYYKEFGQYKTNKKETIKTNNSDFLTFNQIKKDEKFWYSTNINNKIYVLTEEDYKTFKENPNDSFEQYPKYANPRIYGRPNKDAPSF